MALASLVFSAQAAGQDLRVGYVDMKTVLDNAPQVVDGRKRLDQEFRSRNDEIEADEVRLGDLEVRLARGDMTQDSTLQLERQIRELQRSINRRKEDLRDELSFRRTEEVQRLEEEINLAVQEIAERNGYDLIVTSPVIYVNPRLDITDMILDQLEIEFAADQLEFNDN
jgi:outer membrane protein